MKKQNIEDIFSSIESFSSVPPPELWNKIEEQLDKPKKKKRAILWWPAAACLLLGLIIPAALHFNSTSKNESILKNVIENNNVVLEKQNSFKTKNQKLDTNSNAINQHKTVVTATPEINSEKTSNKKYNAKENVKNESLTEKSLFAKKHQTSQSVTNKPFLSKNNTAVVINSFNQKKQSETYLGSRPENENPQKPISFDQKDNNKSILLLNKKDSLQLAELHSLEKSKENPKKEIKTNPVSKTEKWSVEVFAGIANSENYKNEKTLGNLNSSRQSNVYGVKTNYKLNKKWAVSSGLKMNELGQSIANVSYLNTKNLFYMAPQSNVSANRVASPPQITNNTNYVFVATVNDKTQNMTSSETSALSFESGNIDQRLKYLEMPFEVSYFLLNKNKTSISVNTGGFVGKLISNEVYLNGNSIGNNVNANDFVYGSLLSSTLQYHLYKKTNVFVEPGMNYYANPLSNQSFNQFQWSFNFGLNVSF